MQGNVGEKGSRILGRSADEVFGPLRLKRLV
jgi:hypothetical protein